MLRCKGHRSYILCGVAETISSCQVCSATHPISLHDVLLPPTKLLTSYSILPQEKKLSYVTIKVCMPMSLIRQNVMRTDLAKLPGWCQCFSRCLILACMSTGRPSHSAHLAPSALMALTFPAAYHNLNTILLARRCYFALLWWIIFFFFFFFFFYYRTQTSSTTSNFLLWCFFLGDDAENGQAQSNQPDPPGLSDECQADDDCSALDNTRCIDDGANQGTTRCACQPGYVTYVGLSNRTGVQKDDYLCGMFKAVWPTVLSSDVNNTKLLRPRPLLTRPRPRPGTK